MFLGQPAHFEEPCLQLFQFILKVARDALDRLH